VDDVLRQKDLRLDLGNELEAMPADLLDHQLTVSLPLDDAPQECLGLFVELCHDCLSRVSSPVSSLSGISSRSTGLPPSMCC